MYLSCLRRFTGDSISLFSLDKGLLDVTRDSLRIDFSIEGDAYVTLKVKKGASVVRTLIDSIWLNAGDYWYYWDGLQDNGRLALPDDGYAVCIAAANPESPWEDNRESGVQVLGTLVPASIGVSSTWTTTNDPYVITGHNLEFSGAGNLNLTVNHGVRSLSEN